MSDTLLVLWRRLDEVDFVIGDRYLVTATDGVVNGCGFSGPATPESRPPSRAPSAAN